MDLIIKDESLYCDGNLIGTVLENDNATHYNGCLNIVEDTQKVNLNQIYNLTREYFIEDLYISLFGNRMFNLWQKESILYISVDFFHSAMAWDEGYPISKFIYSVEKKLDTENNLELNEDESGFFLTFTKEIKDSYNIKSHLENIENIYKIKFEEFNSLNKITNSIIFSPEHLTAGSSILQYFGKLLQEKYPNEEVSISINQEGLKVTMIIDTPDGKKEEIEEYLNRYGMVITNQITASEFTSNPIQILELETKLESAKMEIEFQKKLLALQDKTYDINLVSLKDEVNFLREELSSLRTNSNEQVKFLLSSLLSKDKLIKKLTKSIDKKDEQETKKLLLELKNKDKDGYISLKQHIDTAVIGGIVNAPSWIQFTIGIISKL